MVCMDFGLQEILHALGYWQDQTYCRILGGKDGRDVWNLGGREGECEEKMDGLNNLYDLGLQVCMRRSTV